MKNAMLVPANESYCNSIIMLYCENSVNLILHNNFRQIMQAQGREAQAEEWKVWERDKCSKEVRSGLRVK